jgi:Fe2+ or Zn2+ uptake regulation protein
MERTAIAERLHGAGLRVTQPRLAVLTVLTGRSHLDAERVFGELVERRRSLSKQSVHNVLRDLTAAGLLRRIEPANPPALYESRVGDNHHHVVCHGCGAVHDVDCVVGQAPCLEPSDAAGFRIDVADVVFWGWCAECTARGLPDPSRFTSPRKKVAR